MADTYKDVSIKTSIAAWKGSPYDASYYFNSRAGYTDYNQGAATRATNIADDIETYKSVDGLKVIVGGCAFGYLVKELYDRGADVTGIDISKYAIDQAKAIFSGIASRFSVQDVLEAISRKNTYDIIVSNLVLDCMPTTEKAQELISEAKRAAKSNGMAYFLTTTTSNYYLVRTSNDWRTDLESEFTTKTVEITTVGHLPLGADIKLVVT